MCLVAHAFDTLLQNMSVSVVLLSKFVLNNDTIDQNIEKLGYEMVVMEGGC